MLILEGGTGQISEVDQFIGGEMDSGGIPCLPEEEARLSAMNEAG